jgi:hypothetical protein
MAAMGGMGNPMMDEDEMEEMARDYYGAHPKGDDYGGFAAEPNGGDDESPRGGSDVEF